MPNKAIAIIPNCAATRHIHFELDGSGAASFEQSSMDIWPEIKAQAGDSIKRVNIDTVTQKRNRAVASW